MRLRGTVIGALNLFHIEPGEMDDADVDAAQALADVATIAILQHRAALEAQVLNEQLNHALNSRIVIEQAKGMVAEREGLDMEQAFPRPCATTPATTTQPRSIVRLRRNHPDDAGEGVGAVSDAYQRPAESTGTASAFTSFRFAPAPAVAVALPAVVV